VFRLLSTTGPDWQDAVRGDLVAFMQDHCHNERKAAAGAMTLAHQNFRRTELVAAMIDMAAEEVSHFRQVHDLLAEGGHTIGQDQPDPYMGSLFKLLRRSNQDEFLLDRLIVFSVVEARGCERFRLAAEVMPEPRLRAFYEELFACEARHHGVYLDLARLYFGRESADARMVEVLEAEAAIVRDLPVRPSLH